MNNYNIDGLKTKITVQHASKTKTAHGNIIYTFDKQESIFASVAAFTSKIIDGATENLNELDYHIIIRYRKDYVGINDRIIYNSTALKLIGAPIDINNEHNYLLLICREFKEDKSK